MPEHSEPSARLSLEGLIEFVPDAIVIVSRQGHISLVNSQTERLFGYDRKKLLGQPVEVLIPDRFRGDYVGHRRTYFDGPRTRPMSFGLCGLRRDGTQFPVDITLSPLPTDDGVLAMTTIRDVTDYKRAQQALEEKTRALEAAQDELVRYERLAVLGQIAAGVSHELRNPLGVIKNAVYFLNMVLPNDPKVRKHLVIVEREIAAANRIVTGLLDFARVTPSTRADMDVNALVREYLGRAALPDHVVPVVALADRLSPVHADAGQVELIVGNLVANAVQAMPGGGTLTVETGVVEGDVRLTVGDTGVGISTDDLDKIFEPLFTTKAKAKGIGLGLSVARRLARANGATLSVTSTPGLGSRFELRFSSDGTGTSSG